MVCTSARVRDALALGAWFGFGYFVIGLYWIGNAFMVDAAKHGWAAPFAVILLAGGMAVFPALVTLGVRMLRPAGMPGFADVFHFAALWMISEWVRSWIFTGFPWNLIGTVWTFSDAMIQFAAVTGVYGLGFVTIFTMSAPALLVLACERNESRRHSWVGIAMLVAPLALLASWGEWRLGDQPGLTEGVRLRLVQPAIPQHLKWLPEHRADHVRNQLRLSRAPASDGNAPTHVIWAETAVPFVVSKDAGLRAALAAVAPPAGALIVGAPRVDGEGPGARVTNSVHAINASGRILATYDKFHLVPFGEYVPFPELLRISKLTAGRGDFSPGPGPRTLEVPGLPAFSPLICYEIIFPDRITDPSRRPDWILNLTNDGWFGESTGPHQHFAAARLRAVEQGLPLVRVANAGISAIVDAHGRVLKSLSLGQSGILDGPLPKALAEPTAFARWGTYPLLGLAVLMILTGFIRRRRSDNL